MALTEATLKYLAPETLAAMSVEDLKAARLDNSRFAQMRYGVRLGALSTARGNVLRIGKELKARGLDSKGGAVAVKDESGLVAAAVAPQQEIAIAYAREQAQAYIERVVAQFAGKELDKVAPRAPSSRRVPEYRAANARRDAICAILDARKAEDDRFKPHAPLWLVRNPKREAQFVEQAATAAGEAFIAYVAKLEEKVGPGVTKAELSGQRLWQGSTLTVSKGAVVEKWFTQQIVNYSVLGNAYNQWPTRKVK